MPNAAQPPVGQEAGGGEEGRKPGTATKKRPKSSELLARLRALHDTHQIAADRLEVIQKLGEGGFAHVDLCWYTRSDGTKEQVAVKRVRPDVLRHATQLKLFTNESEILVKLKHPNVVQLIGLGSLDSSTDDALRDTFYLVEELVNGGSLRLVVLHQMIQAPAPLYRIRDGVRWSLQMAKALQYLHSRSPPVVHRDLKPDNVLLTSLDPSQAEIKLADFGLSVTLPNKHVQGEARTSDPPSRSAAREARWRRSMLPRSGQSTSGAAAMLQLIESASLAAAYESNSNSLPANGGRPVSGVVTSTADMAAAANAAAAAAASGAPNSRSHPYVTLANHSRGGGPPTSRNSMGHGPTSRGGVYSHSGVQSRGSLGGPVSGLLGKLARGERNLECPSGVMFDLTSMTGSLLYMAPEVFKGEPYNMKADTFSFGILAYELLHQRLIMASLIAQQLEDGHSFENEILEFTRCVSAGFRPSIEPWLPDYMQQLICSCWAQSPMDRPNMQHVIDVLQRFLDSPELDDIDRAKAPSTCCTIS